MILSRRPAEVMAWRRASNQRFSDVLDVTLPLIYARPSWSPANAVSISPHLIPISRRPAMEIACGVNAMFL